MILLAKGNVHFYNSLRDTVVSCPHTVLSNKVATFMLSRFEAWIKTEGTHPDLAAMSDDMKRIHLEAATVWCNAINNAIQDGYFPIVILPEERAKAAVSHLHAVCPMETDPV